MPRSRRSRQQTDPQFNTTSTQTIADKTANEKPLEEVDVSSSDTEMEAPAVVSTKSKPKLQIFKGVGDKVSIENWIKRFEMLSIHYKWVESEQVIMIGNYLEDDAMNWYIENCSDNNFSNLKHKLISRFGLETVEPIVEFINTKYDIKNGVKEYFETKRRLGIAAKLTEEQMIPLMVHNLHPKMVDCFTAVKPKTFSEFYAIAKTSENNLKRNQFIKPNENPKFKPKTNPQFNDKNKRKPPNPCKICENLGFKNRFHWGNDCRNRKPINPQNQTNAKTVNTIEKNSDNPENDINNIDLNY